MGGEEARGTENTELRAKLCTLIGHWNPQILKNSNEARPGPVTGFRRVPCGIVHVVQPSTLCSHAVECGWGGPGSDRLLSHSDSLGSDGSDADRRRSGDGSPTRRSLRGGQCSVFVQGDPFARKLVARRAPGVGVFVRALLKHSELGRGWRGESASLAVQGLGEGSASSSCDLPASLAVLTL